MPFFLRHRSLISAAAGLTVVMVLLAWAWLTLDPAVQDVGRLESERLPKLALLQQARFADLEASLALRNALLLSDERLVAGELRRYERLQAEAGQALTALQQRVGSSEGADPLRELQAARALLLAEREQAAVLARIAGDAPPPDAATNRLQAAQEGYVALLQAMSLRGGSRVSGAMSAAVLTTRRASMLLAAAGLLAALTLGAVVASWRRDARAQLRRKDDEIHRLQRQHDALVREVHHRIKNHLQGLLGLVEGHRAGRPEAAPVLDTVQGHVLALVGIHGLQADVAGDRVRLQELVQRQLPLVSAAHPGASVALRAEAGCAAALVDGPQAVPVALVIHELIANAVKHGVDRRAEVVLERHEAEGGGCRVRVTNRSPAAGPLPRDGSLFGPVDGNGLALVEALAQGVGRVCRLPAPTNEVAMALELHHRRPAAGAALPVSAQPA